MVSTAFGVFVYAAFTIVAGALDVTQAPHEPSALVILNGIVELVEVRIGGPEITIIAPLKMTKGLCIFFERIVVTHAVE